MKTLELPFPAKDTLVYAEPTVNGHQIDHEGDLAAALGDVILDVAHERGLSAERFAEISGLPVDGVRKALAQEETGIPLGDLWKVAVAFGLRAEMCLFTDRVGGELPVRVMRMSNPNRFGPT
ncbi:hypothetical protein [Methylobacterium ajmalii]|uniref:hypothetical protein n=1 Tax=Methylobacterium ajmalii TaxID=2738439 RepID=UPI002F35F133